MTTTTDIDGMITQLNFADLVAHQARVTEFGNGCRTAASFHARNGPPPIARSRAATAPLLRRVAARCLSYLAGWVKRVEALPRLRFRPLATSPAVLPGCLARKSMMRALTST